MVDLLKSSSKDGKIRNLGRVRSYIALYQHLKHICYASLVAQDFTTPELPANKMYLALKVLVWFPNGERKRRMFESNTKIQTLYDYVDSLGVLETEEYSLITNFPKTVYGKDKESMSLKDAGLHPQASLFIEIN
ncbi:hypothetical protein Bca52824_032806 [Brassica carinata]|uniref:UBX domain-containing protein n=1 Tax=Brassica carinata TaxID=52824 RepID=A0A8X7V5H4_BRACI|nr:hypothetical protein Bca52824_032806 [Brassica carinata]